MAGITTADAQKILDHDFAPCVQALDIRIEAIDGEGARLRTKFGAHLSREGGTVCGQSINLMRAIASSDVIAKAKVVRMGRTLAFGEVLLYADGDERPAAHATSTFAMLREGN